jgi:hypothetical protein
MRWVTRAKFASIAQISRKSASNAVNRGDVDIRKEGGTVKIDMDGPLTKQYLDRIMERKAGAPDQGDPGQGDQPAPDTDLESMAAALGANVNQLSRSELDRLKAIEQIRAIKQKTDQARRNLIDRALVAQAFAKIYAVDVNEFRTLGANLAPGLASIFGADRPDLILQAEQSIEAEVFKVLGHVKRIINDFLKSIEAERLK